MSNSSKEAESHESSSHMHCQAVAMSVGEIFGDFGVELTNTETLKDTTYESHVPSRWRLQVWRGICGAKDIEEAVHSCQNNNNNNNNDNIIDVNSKDDLSEKDEIDNDNSVDVHSFDNDTNVNANNEQELWEEKIYKKGQGECSDEAVNTISCNNNNQSCQVIYDKVMNYTTNAHKVIKLSPNSEYSIRVCVYYRNEMKWSDWSECIYTKTLPPVHVIVDSVGEEYLELRWTRATDVRNNKHLALTSKAVNDDDDNVNDKLVKVHYAKEKYPEERNRVAANDHFEVCLCKCDKIRLQLPSNNAEIFPISFHEMIESGLDRCTFRGLCPGAVYAVYIRYRTLIHTTRNWIYATLVQTALPLVLSLETRGENVISVKWTEPTESNVATCANHENESEESNVSNSNDAIKRNPETKVSHISIHPAELRVQFIEVCVESNGVSLFQHQFASSTSSTCTMQDRLTNLEEDTHYEIFVRRFFLNGKWGVSSNVVKTRTFAKPVVSLRKSGEEYLLFTWNRLNKNSNNITNHFGIPTTTNSDDYNNKKEQYDKEIENEGECLEYVLRDIETGVKQRRVIQLTNGTDKCYSIEERSFTIHNLKAGKSYSLTFRIFVCGEWGEWVAPSNFATQGLTRLRFIERGEDFFTLEWPTLMDDADHTNNARETIIYNIVVTTTDINKNNTTSSNNDESKCKRVEVLNEEVSPYSSKFSCLHENKASKQNGINDNEADNNEENETMISKLEPIVLLPESSSSSPQTKAFSVNGTLERLPVCGFKIKSLNANTPYDVKVRRWQVNPVTQIGEWGNFTKPIRVCTLPSLTLQVLDIGEDFAQITWRREMRTPATGRTATTIGKQKLGEWTANGQEKCSEKIEEEEEEEDVEYAVDPQTKSSSASLNTALDENWDTLKYEVVVGNVTTGEDVILHKFVLENSYTITNLHPSNCYTIAVRACNASSQWGLWSKMQIQTITPIETSIHEIGEDFVRIMWHRHTQSFPMLTTNDKNNNNIKNENDLDNNITSCASANSFISRYAILVYSTEYETLMQENHENNINLNKNINNNNEDTDANVCTVHISHDGALHEESGYANGGNAEISRYCVIDGDLTSYCIRELLPNRVYNVVLRACTTSGQWGLWSNPLYFRTNPQFVLPMNHANIGENYVMLHWIRDESTSILDKLYDNYNKMKNKSFAKHKKQYTEAASSLRNTNKITNNVGSSSSAHENDVHDESDVIHVGDLTVMSQFLRIEGVNLPFTKEYNLEPHVHELKVYNLQPGEAYRVQHRACGKSGYWGLWNTPTHFLTRNTILTRAIEVAEDYVVISWERGKVNNPSHYPTGRGVISSYHLRVYSNKGNGAIHTETFLGDGDCPYRISGLLPNTYYCVEMKAAYNDEIEWGLWSAPLWCLTMSPLRVETDLIAEEMCQLSIHQPIQQRRLPEDDGLAVTENKLIAFGAIRPTIMLCVTTPIMSKYPFGTDNKSHYYHTIIKKDNNSGGEASAAATGDSTENSQNNEAFGKQAVTELNLSQLQLKPSINTAAIPFSSSSSSLPPEAMEHNHRLVYQTELTSTAECIKHTVANLKMNTSYCVSVRSKLPNGEWGMWSPSTWFATVPGVIAHFTSIGEAFVSLEWNRLPQQCVSTYVNESDTTQEKNELQTKWSVHDVKTGIGIFTKSRVKVRAIYSGTTSTSNGDPQYNNQHRHYTSDNDNMEIKENNNLNPLGNPSDFSSSESHPISSNNQRIYNIDGSTNVLRINNLSPATTYAISVQTFSPHCEWGAWSDEVKVRTVPAMAITITHTSEDALWACWTRQIDYGSHVGNADPNTVLNANVLAKSYEVEVCQRALCFHFSTQMESEEFFMRGLCPGTVYTIRVRAQFAENDEWGVWSSIDFPTKPQWKVNFSTIGEHFAMIEWRRHVPQSEQEYSTFNEWTQRRSNELINTNSNSNSPGALITVPASHNNGSTISNRSVSLLSNTSLANLIETEDIVRQFRFKVQRVGEARCTIYDLGPSVSRFKLRQLQPASEYRVWMCSKGHENVWGLWNDEIRVRTLPKLQVNVCDAGEDYIRVEWNRPKWASVAQIANENNNSNTESKTSNEKDSNYVDVSGSSNNDKKNIIVREVDGAASGYEVRVRKLKKESFQMKENDFYSNNDEGGEVEEENDDGDDDKKELGEVVLLQTCSHSEKKCVLGGLNADTTYTVEVRAKDTYEEWGLWSTPIAIHTLSGVQVELTNIAETFVDIAWHRLVAHRADHAFHEAATLTRNNNYKYKDAESKEMQTRFSDNDSNKNNVYYEDEHVKEWHIRVQCTRVYGGLPLKEDYREFHANANELQTRLNDLLPHTTYSISIRALNQANEWGHWSSSLLATTYPLLDVQVDIVGETFINVKWTRPGCVDHYVINGDNNNNVKEDAAYGCYDPSVHVSFPGRTKIHNYLVSIKPFANEPCFNEADEPLDDTGARVYETSQPYLRLSYLLPGTRYTIYVCEQLIDELNNFMENVWGAASYCRCVETVPPLRVVPVEIGEDYCLVEWKRLQRANRANWNIVDSVNEYCTEPNLPITHYVPQVVEYELHIKRLCDDAITEYDGIGSLNVTESLQASLSYYQKDNLLHSTIYEIRVRAKADNDIWNPWSPVTKFVTLSRLQLSVKSVYARHVVVEWCRPLPEWTLKLRRLETQEAKSIAQETHHADEQNTVKYNDATVIPEEEEEEQEEQITVVEEHSSLNDVLLGDYTIKLYEISVDGLSTSLHSAIRVGKEYAIASIGGLIENTLYTIAVRSLSENAHWSRFSNTTSVLTLHALELQITQYTENSAVLHWSCKPSNVHAEFGKLLHDKRVMEERQFAEKERQDLFELKRRIQEREDKGEPIHDWEDEATRRESNAIKRAAALFHLFPENVAIGENEINSAFQLQIYTNDTNAYCHPQVRHEGRVKLIEEGEEEEKEESDEAAIAKNSANKGEEQQQSRKKWEQASCEIVHVSVNQDVLQQEQQEKEQKVEKQESDEANTEITEENNNNNTVQEGMLLDIKLCANVHEAIVENLRPSSHFTIHIRSRNDRLEWEPWSVLQSLQTLLPLCLDQSRFGEHYINLYWLRLSEEEQEEWRHDAAQLQLLQPDFILFQHDSEEERERKRSTMSSSALTNFNARWKEYQELRQRVQERKVQYATRNNAPPIACAANTPIMEYRLRVIDEKGDYNDITIDCQDSEHHSHHDDDDDDDGNNDETNTNGVMNLSAYTVTGLIPNNLYICLLCPYYGNNLWGEWSAPLKFMTTNLLQLQITFMSESYVDVSWQRMDNKRLPIADRENTLMSGKVSDEEHTYQIRLCHSTNSSSSTSHVRSDGHEENMVREESNESFANSESSCSSTTNSHSTTSSSNKNNEQNNNINSKGEVEEFRTITACHAYRIIDLLSDTKYTLAVREWDAKGEWGLWCTPRMCVTMPTLKIKPNLVGEDYLQVNWQRNSRSVDYTNDMHVLQYDVETIGYYVRVREWPCDAAEVDYVEDNKEVDNKENEDIVGVNENILPQGELAKPTQPLEFDGMLSNGRYCLIKYIDALPMSHSHDNNNSRKGSNASHSSRRSSCVSTASSSHHSLSAATEKKDEEKEQRGGNDMMEMMANNLAPDCCFNVQVCSVLRNQHLGCWTQPSYVQTLPALAMEAFFVNEKYIDLRWKRETRWQHKTGRLCCHRKLFTDVYKCVEYELEASSTPKLIDSSSSLSHEVNKVIHTKSSVYANHTEEEEEDHTNDNNILTTNTESEYNLNVKLNATAQRYRLDNLSLNQCYMARIRSRNERDENSLWTTPLKIRTLAPLIIRLLRVTEDAMTITWKRQDVEHDEDEVQLLHEDIRYELRVTELASTDYKTQNYSENIVTNNNLDRSSASSDDDEQSKNENDNENENEEDKFAENVVYNEVLDGRNTSFVRLPNLSPNTRYKVVIRAMNVRREWGEWSQARVVTTLKRLVLETAAFGESYVRLRWHRVDENEIDQEEEEENEVEQKELQEKTTRHNSKYLEEEEELELCVKQPCISKYELYVQRGNESDGRVIEIANVNAFHGKYTVHHLQPNTHYSFTVRASYSDYESASSIKRKSKYMKDEWGMCSDMVHAYTIPLLVMNVNEVGEDYVKLKWKRGEMLMQNNNDTNSNNSKPLLTNTHAATINTKEEELENKDQHEDDDEPITSFNSSVTTKSTNSGIVNNNSSNKSINNNATNRVNVVSNITPQDRIDYLGKVEETICYEVALYDFSDVALGEENSVSLTSREPPITLLLAAEDYYCFVNQLTHNHRYRATVRRWYAPLTGFNSNCIDEEDEEITPLNSLEGARMENNLPKNRLGVVEELLNSPSATTENTNTSREIATLLSNALDDKERDILELIRETHALAGEWSTAVYAVTLQPIICLTHTIGEDNFVLQWQRDNRIRALLVKNNNNNDNIETLLPISTQFHIHVDQMNHDGSGVDHSVHSYHLDDVLHNSQITQNTDDSGNLIHQYTIGHLHPNSLYVVSVRCCTNERWGQWSEQKYVLTAPLLHVNCTNINEDKVTIEWNRPVQKCEEFLCDGIHPTMSAEERCDRFELEVIGINVPFSLNKRLKGLRHSFTVHHLQPNAVYRIRVRASDGLRSNYTTTNNKNNINNKIVDSTDENTLNINESQTIVDKTTNSAVAARHGCWKWWSPSVYVATLMPIQVTLEAMAENFIYISWKRAVQTASMYNELVQSFALSKQALMSRDSAINEDSNEHEWNAHVLLGDPSIFAYHLCVFDTSCTPSLAVIDKQLHSQTERYRVSNLASDCTFIAIVRACAMESKEWGLWSDEQSFCTQRQLQLNVRHVGESYLKLQWERDEADEQRLTGSMAHIRRVEPVKYICLLRSVCDGKIIDEERNFTPEECEVNNYNENNDKNDLIEIGLDGNMGKHGYCYTLHHLLPDTLYYVALQPYYGNEGWGPWSSVAQFITLPSLIATVQVNEEHLQMQCTRQLSSKHSNNNNKNENNKMMSSELNEQLMFLPDKNAPNGTRNTENTLADTEANVHAKKVAFAEESTTATSTKKNSKKGKKEHDKLRKGSVRRKQENKSKEKITNVKLTAEKGLEQQELEKQKKNGTQNESKNDKKKDANLTHRTSEVVISNTKENLEKGEEKVNAIVESLPGSSPCLATDNCLLQSQDLPQRELIELTTQSTMRRFHVILCREADMHIVFANHDVNTNKNSNKEKEGDAQNQDRVIIEVTDSEDKWDELNGISSNTLQQEKQLSKSANTEEMQVNKHAGSEEEEYNKKCIFIVEEYIDHSVLNEQPFEWEYDKLPFDTRLVLSVQAFDVNGCWGKWIHVCCETKPLAPVHVQLHKFNAQFCALQWSMPTNEELITKQMEQTNDMYVGECKDDTKSNQQETNNALIISADSNAVMTDIHSYNNQVTTDDNNLQKEQKANNDAMKEREHEREPRRYRFVVEQKYILPERSMAESSASLENKKPSTNSNQNKNKMESLFASSAPPNTIARSLLSNSVSANGATLNNNTINKGNICTNTPNSKKRLSASDKVTHKSRSRTNSNNNNSNTNSEEEEWEVVAITSDHVCAIPITGQVSRLRCRVKCCRVYPEGTSSSSSAAAAVELPSAQEQELEWEHPFSDYSEEVSVIPGTPPEAVRDLHITNVYTNKMTMSWNSANVNKTGRRRPTGKHVVTTSGNSNMSYRIYLSEANDPAILIDILTRQDLEEEMETLQLQEKEEFINNKQPQQLQQEEEKHKTHMPKIKRREAHKPLTVLQHTIYNLQPSTQYTLQVVAENEHGMSYNNPIVEFTTESNTLPPIKDATQSHVVLQNEQNSDNEDNAEIVIPTATILPDANSSKGKKQGKNAKRSNSKKLREEQKKEGKRSHSVRDVANKLKSANKKKKNETLAADRVDVTADQIETSNASPLTSQDPVSISVEDSYERDRLIIESNEFDCTSDNVLMLLPERSSSAEIVTSHRTVNASNTETSENVNYTSGSTDMISLPMISRTMEIVTEQLEEEQEERLKRR